MLTYFLQHGAIQRSAIVSPNTGDLSCSRTFYNAQRSRGQQLSRPGLVIDYVHLRATTHSDPEVSNRLSSNPCCIMITNLLQHLETRKLAIAPQPWSTLLT